MKKEDFKPGHKSVFVPPIEEKLTFAEKSIQKRIQRQKHVKTLFEEKSKDTSLKILKTSEKLHHLQDEKKKQMEEKKLDQNQQKEKPKKGRYL